MIIFNLAPKEERKEKEEEEEDIEDVKEDEPAEEGKEDMQDDAKPLLRDLSSELDLDNAHIPNSATSSSATENGQPKPSPIDNHLNFVSAITGEQYTALNAGITGGTVLTAGDNSNTGSSSALSYIPAPGGLIPEQEPLLLNDERDASQLNQVVVGVPVPEPPSSGSRRVCNRPLFDNE